MKGVNLSKAAISSDSFLRTPTKTPDQAVVEELHKHASHPLEHLTIAFSDFWGANEAVARLPSVFGVPPHVNRFPLLVRLDMQGRCLSEWKFVKDLPCTLQILNVKLRPTVQVENWPSAPPPEPWPCTQKLDCFNALDNLRQLCVCFQTLSNFSMFDAPVSIAEDLRLPRLETLQLDLEGAPLSTYSTGPVILDGFSAVSIPSTCIVAASEIIDFWSDSAKPRIWSLITQ